MAENDASKTGEWTDTRETYFWYDRGPFQAKYDLEKLTGTLLELDRSSEDKLVYRGSSVVGVTKRALELRFEAVLPRAPYVRKPPTELREYRNLFFLRAETSAPRQWETEEDVKAAAARAFGYWTLRLPCGSQQIAWADASRPFYEQQAKEAIEQEMELASRVEDPNPIIALQKQVLVALRDGKSFRTSHKEGGTRLYFNGKTFLKEEFGEQESVPEFATDQEMIDCIRQFYDWDSRKESYPHKPAELEVWKYIQGQLRG
ncbi:MAG: hypothetical protein LAP38_15950 [Acidobacteriia bacterium]|nr:hypothetical protein [Terriglobia bacterium]